MLANLFQKVSFWPTAVKMLYRASDLLSKMHITMVHSKMLYRATNRQQSMLFTSIAQMYRNTVTIYRGDRLNLQRDMSLFTPQIQFSTEST